MSSLAGMDGGCKKNSGVKGGAALSRTRGPQDQETRPEDQGHSDKPGAVRARSKQHTAVLTQEPKSFAHRYNVFRIRPPAST